MPTKKKPRAVKRSVPLIPVPLLAPIAEAFARDGGVDIYKTTSLRADGKVFAMIVKERFVTKLPAERVSELVAAGKGAFFSLGPTRVMKEWLSVPTSEKASWLRLAKESRAFVSGH